MVTCAALAAFERRRSCSRSPRIGAACGEVPDFPRRRYSLKAVLRSRARDQRHEGGRNPETRSRKQRAPVHSRRPPEDDAGMLIGRQMIAATNPRKTASTSTRSVVREPRGAGIDRCRIALIARRPDDQHKSERKVESRKEQITRDVTRSASRTEPAPMRGALRPAPIFIGKAGLRSH